MQTKTTPSLIPNPFAPKYDPKTPAALALDLKWSGKDNAKPRDQNSRYADPGIDFTGDPGLTDQSQAAEADVNNVMKRYMQTGVLPGVNVAATYGDFADVPSYQDALNLVINAQHQFNSLDAYQRKKFENDPAQFLAFATDPKNAEELIKLGLATQRPQSPIEALTVELRSSREASKPQP